ncbi:MAG: 4Fe-4S dicluster domain-containing protein [Bacteroidetes bacterium]|nr:4Fe-4S dicluster domain-containing protein [Bacteroidota bacterium]
MTKSIVFAICILITLGVFSYTAFRIFRFFKLTKAYPVKDWGKRFVVMMKVAFGQTKIFRRPTLGLMHALVWWGFIIILIGSVEMIIDGLAGTERVLSVLGPVYDIITSLGDVFALIILLLIFAFLFRRLFMHIKRFSGVEMKHISHMDANFALSLIGLLMISLLGMNTFYIIYTHSAGHEIVGLFPVSTYIAGFFGELSPQQSFLWHEINWWSHILWIFVFANVLPYSKHFHVFMSVPNVFLSRLEPLGYLPNMPEITDEVKLMMDPNAAFADPPPEEEGQINRFGVLDAEDVTWKNYLDSLACTECGRCTAVCPANITGKLLSPRKIMMDLRARMKEKGPGLVKDKNYNDERSLIRSYISEEELWACTTCNACAQECPVNINHPSLIMDMRRYLVMEESAAPGELNAMFTNIENNGAPWQFSPEDRMLWAEGLEVPLMADLQAAGKTPEYLLWIGSAGAFDDRYKKVSKEFVKVLNHLKVDYAVLGTEEVDSGDVARRAGNEMLFQMQSLMIIETMNMYGVKKVLTACPHDYNTFKNEYPDLGGNFEVIHHSQFLSELIKKGKLKLNANGLAGKKITFHDPCYLGRANGEYKAPRVVVSAVEGSTMIEMKRNKSFALCCGAGGGQMFKEAEKGDKEVFLERIEDVIECKADIVATACPFCMVMMTDGIKYKNREEDMKNYDIVELVSIGMGI